MSLWKKLRWRLVLWAVRRLPPCCDISHRISDGMQTPQPLRERIVIHMHLMVCDWCTSYKQQIALMGEAARRQSQAVEAGAEMPLHLSDAARGRLREMLRGGSDRV